MMLLFHNLERPSLQAKNVRNSRVLKPLISPYSHSTSRTLYDVFTGSENRKKLSYD